MAAAPAGRGVWAAEFGPWNAPEWHHHLSLAVPHSIHGRSPYDFAVDLISALYAREVPQRHVRGILVAGY
jgi:hypothetical protein